MKSIEPNRSLILDILLFLLLNTCIWVINIVVQSSIPGSDLFPFSIRSFILAGLLAITYFLNYKYIRKNILNAEILRFKPTLAQYYIAGIVLGCVLIASIWAIIYLIYPFEIIKNISSKSYLLNDIIAFSLGNIIEELLFRGFLLLIFIKLIGKLGGICLVSFLFGLFHLQGTGFTIAGLSMLLTTFSMSLLFIAVIYYTKSIWTAATLHITGNFLLHTLGFDGATNGVFQIKFSALHINGLLITFVYEVVVLGFAIIIFSKASKEL